MLADLVQDLRLAIRQLAKSPGFALAAVLCLGLGIGANTAVFSFADFFLFRALPVAHPERLVRTYVSWVSGLKYGSVSYPDYVDLREKCDAFDGVAAAALTPFHLSADGRNERLWGEIVSANYFPVLGVQVPLGRGFQPEEESAPGAHPVVVLSHTLWQKRFAADPSIVGRSLSLNGRPFTVIGVAAAGFEGANIGIKTALWAPLGMQEAITASGNRLVERNSNWLSPVIARLAPGVSRGEAEKAANGLMAQLVAAYPDADTGKSVTLLPETEAGLHPMVRSGFAAFIGLMSGVVALVLLLACSNVAGLLLARAAGRRREMAVRLALGAGRGRIVRQLLAESTLLTVLAGVAGLGFALLLTRYLSSFQPPVDVPLFLDLRPNGRILGFTALASALAALVFGLAPAFESAKAELVPGLKDGSGGGRQRGRLRRVLVAGQVALSFVLLLGASLALQSMANAKQIDVGFEAEHLVTAGVDLGLQGYSEARQKEFLRTLETRMQAQPGVTATGWASSLPLSFGSRQMSAIPEGYTTPQGSNPPAIDYNEAGPGYFAALGLPLVAGRGFAREDADGPAAIVVNQTFARQYWGEQEPLGKTVHVMGADHTVVGVVRDGKYFSLGETAKPYLFLPIERYPDPSQVLHVRTAGDPTPMLDVLRREIHALDPTLPPRDLKRMHDQLGFVLFPTRLAAVAIGGFGLLALLLSAVGLYAVLAYWVSQRVPEIGLRIALGAKASGVQGLVIRQALGLTAAGLAVGLVVSFLLAQAATKVLYGIDPAAPGLYLAATALLSLAALLAGLLPAYRATRISPVRALGAS